MLFRQSLEIRYRQDLFQSMQPSSGTVAITPLRADKYIAMSMMQKAIRRGEYEFAFSAAQNLLNSDSRAFWRRMCIIVFEDIGIANLDLVGRITIAAGDSRLRQKLGGDHIVAATLVSEMCNSEKDRTTDDLLEFVERSAVLRNLRDELAELDLRGRLAGAMRNDQRFSHQATAAWAASVGLTFEPTKISDRIACPTAYFETQIEHGFDRTCVELSKLGLSRSGVPLAIFLPLIGWKLASEQTSASDDPFPPATLIKGIPSWVFNGHTRTGLAAFREYLTRSPRIKNFVDSNSTKELSKPKIVASLIFRLESGQMTKRLHWPTGDHIRVAIEQLGWGIPDEAVSEGNRIILDEFDLINDCRATAAQLYL